MSFKAKRQYLLTLQASGYCLAYFTSKQTPPVGFAEQQQYIAVPGATARLAVARPAPAHMTCFVTL